MPTTLPDALFEQIYAALPSDSDVHIRSLFDSKHPFTSADAENIMSELCVFPASPAAREKVRRHLGHRITTFASFRKGFAYATYHGLGDVALSEKEGVETVEEGVRRLREALDKAISRAEKVNPKKPRRANLSLSPSLTSEFHTPRENPTLLRKEQTPQKSTRKESQKIDGMPQASPELWYTPLPYTDAKVSEQHGEGATENNVEDPGKGEEPKTDDKENRGSNSARVCRLSGVKPHTDANCGDIFYLDDELNNEMNRVERLFQDDEFECESLGSVHNALSLSVPNSGHNIIDGLDSNSQSQAVANDYQEDGHTGRSPASFKEHARQVSRDKLQEDAPRGVVSVHDEISLTTVQLSVHPETFTPADTVSRSTELSHTDRSFTIQNDIFHRALNLNSLVEVDEQSQGLRLPKDAEMSPYNNNTDEIRHTKPSHDARARYQIEWNDPSGCACIMETEAPVGVVGEINDECEGNEPLLPYLSLIAYDKDNTEVSNLNSVRGKMPTIQTLEEASFGRLEASENIGKSKFTISTETHGDSLTVEVKNDQPPDAVKSGEVSLQKKVNSEHVNTTCDEKAADMSKAVEPCRGNRREAEDNGNYEMDTAQPKYEPRINDVGPRFKSSDLVGSIEAQKVRGDDKELHQEARSNCTEGLAQFGQYQDHKTSNYNVYDQQLGAHANESCDFGQIKEATFRQSYLHNETSGINREVSTTETFKCIETECALETEMFEDDSIYLSPLPIQTSGTILVDELCKQVVGPTCVKDNCKDRTMVAADESTRLLIACSKETEKAISDDNRATEEESKEWDVDDALDCQEAADHVARTQINGALNETMDTADSTLDGVSETCEFTVAQGIKTKTSSGSMPTPCAPTPPPSNWPALCHKTPPSETRKCSARSNRLQNSPPSEFQSPILTLPRSPADASTRKVLFSSSYGSIAGENGSTMSLETRDSLAAAVQKYVKNAQQAAEMSAQVEVESEESDVTPEGFGQVRKLKPSRYGFTAASEEVQEASEELMGSAVSGRTLSGRRSNVSGKNDEVLKAVRECLEICREVKKELGVRKRRRRLELSMWLFGILALGAGVWVRRRGIVSFVEVML